MARLICTTLVLIVGIAAITTMQLYALSQGINGTLYSLSLVVVGGLIAGFGGFSLKEALSWWKDH